MPPAAIARHLNARKVLGQRSCFLFGPRQTGKSTLIRQQFEGCSVCNLLDQALFVRLSRNPALIREALTPETTLVVIDEMIAEKHKPADDILAGDAEVNLTELSDEALMDLVRLDVTRAAS